MPRRSDQQALHGKVGEKVLKALRTGAPEMFVPAALTPVNRMLGLLGPRSSDALKRRTGIHKLVSQRDLEAERRYQDRVLAEKDAER